MVVGDPPTSLDNGGQNCTQLVAGGGSRGGSRREWSRQERRAYQRIRSGLEKHRGERLRFLTLTSVGGMRKPISKAWHVFVGRVRRMTPMRLAKEGYMRPAELLRYYRLEQLRKPLKFTYFKVRTTEGVAGVVHAIYFGDYLPQMWLSHVWEDLTGGAFVVDVRACRDRVKDVGRLSRYIVAQYITTQEGEKRFSWSRDWVFKGFVAVWRYFVEKLGVKRAVEAWQVYLRDGFVWYEGFMYPEPPPAWGALVLAHG